MPEPYRPAKKVLEQLRSVDFVAVVGVSAAGKTTLIKAAIARDPRLHMLVAGTSRAPRAGEQQGVDFYFDSLENMQQKAAAGEYVTCISHPSGDLYTTSLAEYPAGKTTLLATLSSVIGEFRQLPFRSFRTIYVLPPSYQAWQERLQRHPLEAGQLQRRLQEAEQSLEFGLHDQAAQFVITADPDTALRDFLSAVFGKPQNAGEQAGQQRARQAASAMREALQTAVHQR